MRKTALILAVLLAGCGGTPAVTEPPAFTPEPVYALAENILADDDILVPFNTTVQLETLSEEDMDVLFPVFQESLVRLYKLFDRYHSFSQEGIAGINAVNQSGGEPVEVEPEVFELLQAALELTELTEGRFNPTITRLYDVWSDKFSPFPIEQSDPPEDEITRALGCTVKPEDIYRVIQLDERNRTVSIQPYETCTSSVMLDLGAMAKGYAAEKIGELLKEYDRPFLLNLGSSSIYAYVPETMEYTWHIGIRNPYARVYTLYDVQLEGSGLFTTSGDDSNYFLMPAEEGTILRHHILNPSTGYPENHIRIATLHTDTGGAAADALTTAMFNAEDRDTRIQIIERVSRHFGFEADYAWFEETGSEQGNLVVSKGFQPMIHPASLSSNIKEVEVLK